MKSQKITPGLALSYRAYLDGGRPALAPHARNFLILTAEASPKLPRVVVLLRCDPTADLADLQRHGIVVNQSRGRIRTAIVPFDHLDDLTDHPGVQRVVASRRLRPLMDAATTRVHLPAFRHTTGLTGNGVIIGIVDTGIDPKHPAFAGRIRSIWDQTLPGPGVAEGAYGLELADSQLMASRDTEGHGTHVAGIAAGVHPRFGGIAPKAELVIVKSDLDTAHIRDGIEYIFAAARKLRRPAVVNLSLGGHFDAHDGSDELSEAIQELSGPGRIVCCAAGNEGGDNIHARTRVEEGRLRTVRFSIPQPIPGDRVSTALLNGWYSGQDRMELAIQGPSGISTPFVDVRPDGTPVDFRIPGGRIQFVTPGPDPVNGDHNFVIAIEATPSHTIPGGAWRLRLRGRTIRIGDVDIWALDDARRLDVVFTGTTVDDHRKIGSPGCAPAAITVASFNTKVQWTDLQGTTLESGETLDSISDFSSEGPLRNGAEKPDVAAPGSMIASCLSADSLVEPEFLVASGIRLMQGTSMATPFITGLVALLLERNPHLDPAGAKALLRSHASIPGRPPGTFDPKWGAGLVDARSL